MGQTRNHHPIALAAAILLAVSMSPARLSAGCPGCGEKLFAPRTGAPPPTPEFRSALPMLPAAAAGTTGPLAENSSKIPVAPVFSLLEACPTDAPQVGSRETLDEAQYLNFAQSVGDTFGRRLDPDLRTRLDKLISFSEPGLANAMGILLTAQRSSFAAVYVLAKGAERSPRDPVMANDLGVALKALGEYSQAASALLYAARIAPGRPIVLTNLGFLAIAMRDASYARSAFTRALKADPDEPHAMAGMAMLSECRREHPEAARTFRTALSREFFPMAAVGMEAAMASMTSEEVDQDHEQAGALSHAALPARGRALNVPLPPIPREWSGVQPAYDRVKKYDAENQRRISILAREFQEQRERATNEAGESFSSGVVLLERWPDKQLFALGNLARICSQRLQDLAEIYHHNSGDILSAAHAQSSVFRTRWRDEQRREEEIVVERNRETARCEQHDSQCREALSRKYAPLIASARAQVCKPQAGAGAAAYSRLYPAWKDYWSHGAQEIQAYYARSEPYLRQLDPAWGAAANTWREISIRTDLGNLLVDSIDPIWNARDALVADFMSTEYQVYCPQSPAGVSPQAPTLTVVPEPSQPECRTRWEVELGAARMRADCRKLSFAYEAGPLADLIGKSVLDWVRDSITIVANPRAASSDILGAGAWRNYVIIGEHYYDYGSAAPSGVRLMLDSSVKSAHLPDQMAMVSDIPVSVGTPLRYTPLPEVP